MGAPWIVAVLQALMIGLAIQMTGSVLYVIFSSLWKAIKERMSSRPAGGAPMDLEMGSVNGGEGGSVADDDNALNEGDLELIEEDMAGLQKGTGSCIKQVPAVEGVDQC